MFTSVILIELILILLHTINKTGMYVCEREGERGQNERTNNLHLGRKQRHKNVHAYMHAYSLSLFLNFDNIFQC